MTNERSPGPIFVVGIWRSGTSLLYTLLNQHPRIALTYESDLFLLRSLFRGGSSKPDWLERWEFWNSALSRHNIETSKLPVRIPKYSTAATEIWRQYAKGALHGDKSPNYFDAMQTLVGEFPDARFIVIWRDLADTCRSIVRASEGSPFFAKRGITHRALIGYRKLKRECDALVQRGVPLHQIQYEEMVQSPDTVMQAICAFLQIPFDPRMASLEGADRSAIYDAPQHAGVKKSRKIGLTELHNHEPRNMGLPPKLGEKIARYVAYWKKESAGSWPVYPQNAGDAEPADFLERAGDEVYFRALRALDRFTAFVYCYAPIALLRRYRSAKSQPRALTAAENTALSQLEPKLIRPQKSGS
jgi:Sulfotransferase family